MMKQKPQILLTNDDGIQSPGLWAAAEALSVLGFVNVVAPREQSTGTGRSMPNHSDGIIHSQKVTISDGDWTVYAVGGTPAQVVGHGVLEILPQPPDILVAGINYGENLGSGVTISGTVGAALEGAALGVPSLAVSLETDQEHHLSYSEEVDFSIAAHFTVYFAQLILERRMPFDVDVLKIDIPSDATPDTPWMITRVSRKRYYESLAPRRKTWSEPARIGYRHSPELEQFDKRSDVYVMRIERKVSVTPLSLDLTSRVDLDDLDAILRGD